MTPVHARQGSLTCATWLRDTAHLCFAAGLVYMRDMTHARKEMNTSDPRTLRATLLMYVSATCCCNTLLQHTAATHYCNTLLQHTAATHYCNTLLQHTVATQHCNSLLQHGDMSNVYVRHSHVRHDSCVCATWLMRMCDMTHVYVRHDSCICATWLMYMCDMTHVYVWHDSCVCATWLM